MSKMIRQLIPQPPADKDDLVRWAEQITEILNNAMDYQATAVYQTDHGLLIGLSDDDHSHYVLNDGETTDIINGGFSLTTDDFGEFKYLNITSEADGYQINDSTFATIKGTNQLFGIGAGSGLTSGVNNFFGGLNAGFSVTTADGCIFIGNWAGSSGGIVSTDNLFIVDNQPRTPGTTEQRAIIYGVMDFSQAAQSLNLNVGTLNIGHSDNSDIAVNFRAATNSGLFTWMEDEDYFKFSDDIMMVGGENIIIDTATGTKIGTATNQLLGFYGATPVDQPSTVSDAATQDLTGGDTLDKTKTEADLTSCKNAINAIIDRLQELGLVA